MRTGVFNTVRFIVKEMCHDTRIRQIGFCAAHSVASVLQVGQLVDWFRIDGKVTNLSGSLVKWISQLTPLDVENSPVKNIAYLILRRIPPGHFGLNRWKLHRFSIYQSTFFPVPRVIRDQPCVKCFNFMFDIIPIVLRKQYNNPRLTAIMWRIVDSIAVTDFTFAISECTKADLLKLRPDLDPERVLVVPLAADEYFEPDKDILPLNQVFDQLGLPTPCRFFLTVSSIDPRKNTVAVVQAFSDVMSVPDLSDVHLVIAGPKGYASRALDGYLSANPGLRHRIHVTGYVSKETLKFLYASCEAFVYASSYEGFGIPVVEAMRMGVPVIASRTSSVPEVVGTAGILIDPCNPREISEAMKSVTENKALKIRLASQSRVRGAEFSWRKTVRRIVDVYELALRERN